MRMIGATASLGAVLSCTSSSVFICSSDTDCGEGRCEPSGYCSFQSGDCETGWAYGQFAAPHLAGTCVGATTVGDTETSDTEPTTSAESSEHSTSSEATTTPATTGMDSSTSPPYAESTYGYETGAIPPICVIYSAHVFDCVDEQAGQQAYEYCIYDYRYYANYGEYCVYAFSEYLACLSTLPCRDIGDPAGFCNDEALIFTQAC